MTQAEFNELFRQRTKKFAIDIIALCGNLPQTPAIRVINYQLIRSATSVGANYRAACRARSKAEFYSKISIVVEESDECQFWLEIVEESNFSTEQEIKRLQQEILEIVKVCSKARSTLSD